MILPRQSRVTTSKPCINNKANPDRQTGFVLILIFHFLIYFSDFFKNSRDYFCPRIWYISKHLLG